MLRNFNDYIPCVKAYGDEKEVSIKSNKLYEVNMMAAIIMIVAIRGVAAGLTALGIHAAIALVLEIAIGAAIYLMLSFAWCITTHNVEFKRLFPRLAK